MKTASHKIWHTFVFFSLFFCCSVSCYKPRLVKVETGPVSDITPNSARAEGNLIDIGDGIIEHGHCWSQSPNTDISDSNTSLGRKTNTGSFLSNLQNLQPGTRYYIKAYAWSEDGVVYGNESSFTTLAAVQLPTITTAAVSAIAQTSAVSGGNITSDGGGAITARGVCWGTTLNPTIAGNHTSDGTGTDSFTSTINELQPGTTYHVRAYATNGAGTAYGVDLSFTTPQNITLPTVTTGTTTATSSTTATSGGNVTSDGGATVTARGVCWSTSQNPTILNSRTTNGSGTGSFTSSITGLSPNTTYHVRAYATNSTGTAYGADLSFTTPQNITLPTVTTGTTTATSSTTATSGGNVTSDGGAAVTARGVCWSTNSNPTVSLITKTTNGTGTGSFTSSVTGLSPNTTYHVRAYATNSAGTSYGTNVTFTTPVAIVTPTVATRTTTVTSSTTATSGGNVTSDGGASITARGVCWSTSQNPTISNSRTNDGTGTGSFISNITGLSPNTTYYVRAYATNSAGTSYGNLVSFTSDPTYVTDIDGNVYNIIRVGTQLWMAENLETTKYGNGDIIETTYPATKYIGSENMPKYQWAYNGDENNASIYGRLYTWYAIADIRKVCPVGWHVPSNEEWIELRNYLINNGYGYNEVVDIAKSLASTSGWKYSEIVGTVGNDQASNNSSGFTGRPAGTRCAACTTIPSFNGIGEYTAWWSVTEDNETSGVYFRNLNYTSNRFFISLYGDEFGKYEGLSVRCIRD